jgi:23S rRNA (cytidine1920-2'-O)/16S rRNA (cytidine1409-2'-O)-methyltransferase
MIRLDQALVERGLAPTRARARDAVTRGHVRVGGQPATKPSLAVSATDEIAIDDPAGDYVSRAALKLVAGLDAFAIDAAGRVALDIGASTGGFTQVLLERGATRVIAVDVGHGQLHPSLAADPRVRSLEGLNARAMTAEDIDGERPDLIVSDVSFISLTLALPPALELAADSAEAVFLVKPQFEVGRGNVGKNGIVRDLAFGREAAERVAAWVDGRSGWKSLGLIPSPILGGDGNAEFLLGARRG